MEEMSNRLLASKLLRLNQKVHHAGRDTQRAQERGTAGGMASSERAMPSGFGSPLVSQRICGNDDFEDARGIQRKQISLGETMTALSARHFSQHLIVTPLKAGAQ